MQSSSRVKCFTLTAARMSAGGKSHQSPAEIDGWVCGALLLEKNKTCIVLK
jgi:hypothetical protein